MFDVQTGIKWLVVSRLAELLSQLPPDARVRVNAVGNLLVTDPVTEQSIYVVDFSGDGSVETTSGSPHG